MSDMTHRMIIGYLKQESIRVVFWCLSHIFIVLVLVLSDVTLKVFGYGLILSLFFGVLYLMLTFVRYRNKYMDISRIGQMALNHDLLNHLNVNDMEQLFLGMVKCQLSDVKSMKSHYDKTMEEIRDYYTLWTHQIKTPIAAAGLLVGSDQLEKELLRQELLKIEDYVTSAINYAKLESLSTDMLLEKVDLDEVIKKVAKKYALFFIKKQISFKYENTHYMVVSDSKWLTFVVEQIVFNALKYTNKGSISIKIDPSMGQLIIEDTGIGIAPEDLPRIFEKGYTGYNGHMEKKATGLGLYLCQKSIQQLGLRIHMSSNHQIGTTVIIEGFSEVAQPYENVRLEKEM